MQDSMVDWLWSCFGIAWQNTEPPHFTALRQLDAALVLLQQRQRFVEQQRRQLLLEARQSRSSHMVKVMLQKRRLCNELDQSIDKIMTMRDALCQQQDQAILVSTLQQVNRVLSSSLISTTTTQGLIDDLNERIQDINSVAEVLSDHPADIVEDSLLAAELALLCDTTCETVFPTVPQNELSSHDRTHPEHSHSTQYTSI